MDENRFLTKEELDTLLYEFDDRVSFVDEKILDYLSTKCNDPIERYSLSMYRTYLKHLEKIYKRCFDKVKK